MSKTSTELFAEAAELRKQARRIELKGDEVRHEEMLATPQAERLVYAATLRCPCGAGIAYDPAGPSGSRILGYWDCSSIILGEGDPAETHTGRLFFSCYEVKSENQPSACGATTRPAP